MVQVWYRYGTGMVQVWYRYGTICYRYGTGIDHVWYRYGTGMVQVWYRCGTGMVQYVTGMVQVWYRYGTSMVQVWYRYGTGTGYFSKVYRNLQVWVPPNILKYLSIQKLPQSGLISLSIYRIQTKNISYYV